MGIRPYDHSRVNGFAGKPFSNSIASSAAHLLLNATSALPLTDGKNVTIFTAPY